MVTTPPLCAPAHPTLTPEQWRPPVDGLDVASAAPAEVEVPAAVSDALLDLRLLRGVPLAYLVPDPALLPAESMRFFHVDCTWTDRLVEGALSAGRVGTLDLGFTSAALLGIRGYLDERLEARALSAYKALQIQARGETVTVERLLAEPGVYTWPGREPGGPPALTGFLLRSQAVQRWPELSVSAWDSPTVRTAARRVPVLRREVLTAELLLVLFAGQPAHLELGEPPTGLRFGVEGNAPPYTLTGREGQHAHTELQVPVSPQRVVDLDQIGKKEALGAEHPAQSSQWFAWWFLQPPYTQVFTAGAPEAEGSQPAPENIRLRGRVVPYLPSLLR